MDIKKVLSQLPEEGKDFEIEDTEYEGERVIFLLRKGEMVYYHFPERSKKSDEWIENNIIEVGRSIVGAEAIGASQIKA